jgi:hypothetical protein
MELESRNAQNEGQPDFECFGGCPRSAPEFPRRDIAYIF